MAKCRFSLASLKHLGDCWPPGSSASEYLQPWYLEFGAGRSTEALGRAPSEAVEKELPKVQPVKVIGGWVSWESGAKAPGIFHAYFPILNEERGGSWVPSESSTSQGSYHFGMLVLPPPSLSDLPGT